MSNLLQFLGGAAGAYNKEVEARAAHQRRIEEARENMKNRLKLAVSETEAKRKIKKYHDIEDLYERVESEGGINSFGGQVAARKFYGSYDIALALVNQGELPPDVALPERMKRPDFGQFSIDKQSGEIKVDIKDPAKGIAIREGIKSQKKPTIQGEAREGAPGTIVESTAQEDVGAREQWALLRKKKKPVTVETEALERFQEIQKILKGGNVTEERRVSLEEEANVLMNTKLTTRTVETRKDPKGAEFQVEVLKNRITGETTETRLGQKAPGSSEEIDQSHVQRIANAMSGAVSPEISNLKDELSENEQETYKQAVVGLATQLMRDSEGQISESEANILAMTAIAEDVTVGEEKFFGGRDIDKKALFTIPSKFDSMTETILKDRRRAQLEAEQQRRRQNP